MLQRRSLRSRKHAKSSIPCNDSETKIQPDPLPSLPSNGVNIPPDASQHCVFASVHRSRQTNASGLKRDGIPVQMVPSEIPTTSTAATTRAHGHQTTQRPSYQQYQQQRRQQIMQKQQQQQQLKAKTHWLEPQQQQQHLQQQHQHVQLQQLQQQQTQYYQQPVQQHQQHQQPHQQSHQQPHPQPYQQHLHHSYPQPYDVAPAKGNSRIPVQQQQFQQRQQMHPAASSSPVHNQISKTATHLLNDIYEKHLLNQTQFHEGAAPMPTSTEAPPTSSIATNSNRWHQHRSQPPQKSSKPGHFLKLPPPPPPQLPAAVAAAQQQPLPPPPAAAADYPYSQHFQFTDAYVEPTSSTKQQHFLLMEASAAATPPPPPAPLNHVYETIKERPPMPPPKNFPPHGGEKAAATTVAVAPPLPPSRQMKKHLMERNGTTGRSKRRDDEGKTRTKGQTAAEGAKTKQSSKPPAYGAPPPLTSSGMASKRQQQQQQQQQQQHQQQQHQYNPQQRTKADGEQQKSSGIYQPRRELPPEGAGGGVGGPLVMREMPLGSIEMNCGGIAAASGSHEMQPATNQLNQQQMHHHQPAQPVPPPPANNLSVEQTLRNAGLLDVASGGTPLQQASAQHAIRPTALPIVFEEDTGEFQDVLVLEETSTATGTAKLQYRNGKIEVRLETAQAMAAAAYYARAAQKLAAQQHSASAKSRSSSAAATNSNSSASEMPTAANTPVARNGGFCGALQRAPPPMPPGLARRLANKENYGLGKVKVMLRVSDTQVEGETPHFMAVDKKKRQVTLTDPSAACSVAASTSQERGPMVAAPKMFAFDSLFTAEDQQSDVCASALSEVIPAVLEGSDGCLLTIGYPSSGQSKTMLGGSVNPPSELGAIPCAISWLYKGINERRQKSGARFSVRVSALGVSATKPDSTAKDLLAAHATESDDSPGVYLRDDFLGGPTELRAPTAERAALFLDAALAGRPQGGLEPAMIFTLHVYQYSLSRKGGVAGGRSRLHLIDLGGCANRNGGLPLSGIGNILLAILSGQRHPPNKDHPLTPLLKDCLAPLTCHVAIMAHVTHTQSHTDALTTIQLASRIHRMRRRKHRFQLPTDKSGAGLAAAGLNAGHQSTGSSAGSGADPSSSELSADTVIYMGPSDDATDGEHPPVYLPSLSSGDNRAVMSKALKGSGVQQPSTVKAGAGGSTLKKAACSQKAPQSPIVANRTGSLKRSTPAAAANCPTPAQPADAAQFYSPVHSLSHSASSPKIVAGTLRHPSMTMCSKGSNVPSPKGSPLRRPGVGGIASGDRDAEGQPPGSPMRKITEEQWIDGPRVSRAKVAEARHLMREVNHIKQCETWIDGPKSQSSRSLTAGNLPTAPSQVQGYGFMDQHKKTMIRQWVENQTSQVFQTVSAASSPTHHASQHREQQAQHLRNITYHMSQLKQKSLDHTEDLYATSTRQQQPANAGTSTTLGGNLAATTTNDQYSLRSSQLELVNPIGPGLTSAFSTMNASAPAEIRGSSQYRQMSTQSQPADFQNQRRDENETDLHSTHSLHGYGLITTQPQHTGSASDTGGERHLNGDCDEDQDSGPSEVPPALPLIEPLGSREISHESLHRILSRHVSRESLYQQQQPPPQHQLHLQHHQQQQQLELRRQDELASRQSSHHHFSQHSMGMSDCGLQVTEEEIARTMGSEHPLAALSHCENMSIVSSFNMAGDAFSDCAMGERTRNQFDQLARLREIFTSQLAMAEVTPVFRSGCDVGSVYSEPAYRFNTGPGSVCSEPPYRPPSPRQPSRSPSQGSLPSLNGIMQIAGMEQYASLRHPDGASDPNLPKLEKPFVLAHEDICEVDEKSALLSPSKRPSLEHDCDDADEVLNHLTSTLPITAQSQLPLLPLNTSSEAYDSGHDSSTPRTSKHSGISRRAESGYHSVATARDSDESSFTSGLSKEHHNRITIVAAAKKKRQDKGLCTWLMNPFTCTYPETEGEISDF